MRIFVYITLILLVLVISCKKEDFTNYPGTLTSIKIPKKIGLMNNTNPVSIPNKMLISSDTSAQTAVNFVNIANSVSDFFSFLTPPKNASYYQNKSSATDTYIWYYQTYRVKLEIIQKDDSYSWDVYISDSQQGFEDKLLLSASETINGLNGKLILYNVGNISDFNMQWYWYYDTQNTFHYSFNYPSANMEIKVFNDKSGELKYYFDSNSDYTNELSYSMMWTSQGSGSWTYYNNGSIALQGNWNVN